MINDERKENPISEESKKQSTVRRCLNCGKELKPGQERFCSRSCVSTYYNNMIRVTTKVCKNCGGSMKGIKNKIYCSRECYIEDKTKTSNLKKMDILSGKIKIDNPSHRVSRTLRSALLEKYNNCCQKCGWGKVNTFTGNVPLQIHHKDGNYENNDISNLELLCPNCHSLTESFGNKNVGFGRESRRRYRNKFKTNN